MKTILALSFAFILCTQLPMSAQILTSYEIVSGDNGANITPTITNTATNSATVYTHGTGLTTGGPFGFDVTPSSWASTLASAETANDYVTLSVSPTAGFSLNLTNFDLSGARFFADTGTDVTVALESSVTGFNTQTTDGTFTITHAAFSEPQFYGPDFTLSNAFLNQSSTVTFRLYIYGGTSGDVGLPYDATNTSSGNPNGAPIIIDGTSVSSAPEPSAWAMMLGGLGLLLWFQRRSRNA